MPASTFTKEVLAFSVVLVASWIAVASRMYVRLVVVKKFGFDDWLIVLTLILYTAMIGLAIAMSRLGLGVKDKDLTPEVISHIIKVRIIILFGSLKGESYCSMKSSCWNSDQRIHSCSILTRSCISQQSFHSN